MFCICIYMFFNNRCPKEILKQILVNLFDVGILIIIKVVSFPSNAHINHLTIVILLHFYYRRAT